jgi:hypothetical protein
LENMPVRARAVPRNRGRGLRTPVWENPAATA